MVIAIVVVILLFIVALVCYGVYIVVQKSNKEKESEETTKIAVSGKYAVAFLPVASSLAEKKPNNAELEAWLNSQDISEEQKSKYLKDWQSSIEKTINTINDGDSNGVTAYRIEIGEKDSKICQFLHLDNFITRTQISHNAEILPPYCPGSDSIVVSKQPWEKGGTGGWKSVTPKDGRYETPDWRQMLP
ncbi:MAG: hypothetical protein LBC85_01420 [Fibromonadaceae bacterium]|jgi:flagellar basal body-associated protein FliL|nr:hypothetical protein [Fibromonadaceae bacterium]